MVELYLTCSSLSSTRHQAGQVARPWAQHSAQTMCPRLHSCTARTARSPAPHSRHIRGSESILNNSALSSWCYNKVPFISIPFYILLIS